MFFASINFPGADRLPTEKNRHRGMRLSREETRAARASERASVCPRRG